MVILNDRIPHPQTAIAHNPILNDRTPTSQTAIAHNPPILNNRIPHPQTAIAHNPIILNELLAAALRYRTPTSPNSDRSQPPNFKRLLSQHPQTAIAPHIPKSDRTSHTPNQRTDKSALRYRIPTNPNSDRIPTFPKAIALPHPKSDRIPHIPKTAIALPIPKTAITLPHPQKRSQQVKNWKSLSVQYLSVKEM